MSSFDLYRKKMQNDECCRVKYESRFILEGYASTIIHVLRTNADKQAALTIDNKEGPDNSIVFTYKEMMQNDELLKGDYFFWNNNTYFVYEDMSLVRDAAYKKQKAYQCNVSVEVDDKAYCAYYIASLAKYVDTTLQKNLNITDNEKPMLILPNRSWIEIGKKIIINEKPWKIVDFDLITNFGIAYISLDRDFISKQEDITESDNTGLLQSGIEQRHSINFGYFKTNPAVEIIKKNETEVIYIIPYGVNSLEINTKDKNKVDIKNTYKVVT